MKRIEKVKLIYACRGSVKDDPAASYLFDETFKDVNSSIYAYLINLISDEKLKENPDINKIQEYRSELKNYPVKLENDFQFESEEAANIFLKPLLKREKELFELLD